MAPGNMKSEFVGLQRNKIVSKGALSRKALARIGENVNELGSSVNMAMDDVGSPGNNNGTAASDPKAPLGGGAGDVANPAGTVLLAATTKNPGQTVEQDGELLLGDECTVIDSHEVQHLKALSMLHLDVIEQQQQEIQRNERELQKVRAQNDTLKSRLERIQRRTVLAHKHQEPILNHVHIPAPVSSSDSNSMCKRKSILEHTTPVKRHYTDRESTPTKSPARPPSPISTPTSTRRRRLKLQAKDKTKEERLREAGAKAKDDKKNGETEKDRGVAKGEQYLKTDVIYPCLSDLRVTDPDPALPVGLTVVQVPSWRLNVLHVSTSTENVEDIEDSAFERRHQKYEVAEQKRKRWDIQRVRELREHERLEQKMLRREHGNWDDVLKTFYPEPSDACHVQVSDTVPLVAFGVQVPVAKDCEFELPWYDVSERDKDESRRQTRSRTNRR